MILLLDHAKRKSLPEQFHLRMVRVVCARASRRGRRQRRRRAPRRR
jgi:hypothetical protein